AERADAIVCVSAATADRLRARLHPALPVHVIPHGVDHDRFRAGGGGGDLSALEGLGVHPPYVAFLGTLEPRKDVPTLVAAFDRVAQTRTELALVVAGLDGWGARAVNDAIAQATHRDRIRRVGYVPDSAVPALLRHAAA